MADDDQGSECAPRGGASARDAVRPSRPETARRPRHRAPVTPPVPPVDSTGGTDVPAASGAASGTVPTSGIPFRALLRAAESLQERPATVRPPAASEALTEALTAAQLPLDNTRVSMHDGPAHDEPAGRTHAEPPAGTSQGILDSRTAPTKILKLPLDRASSLRHDCIRTEAIELPPIIELPVGRQRDRMIGRTDRTADRTDGTDRGRSAATQALARRPAAAPPPLLGDSSGQQSAPLVPSATRPVVKRLLWAMAWGASWGASTGGLWSGIQGVTPWSMAVWTLAIGTVIGGAMSMVRTIAHILMRRVRVRAEDRRESHRRMGNAIGRTMTLEPLVNARTFECETCGERQGFSQLERFPIYPCKRRAPEVQCTSCRIVHEDGCGECMAALTEIGWAPFKYLQDNT
jgi:hypothetical protein